MIRTIAFLTAVICTLPLSASAGSLPRSLASSAQPSEAQCLQEFQRSAAARTCTASSQVDVSGASCKLKATCPTGRGSFSKSGVNASYPEGVRQLVNCRGNLRIERC